MSLWSRPTHFWVTRQQDPPRPRPSSYAHYSLLEAYWQRCNRFGEKFCSGAGGLIPPSVYYRTLLGFYCYLILNAVSPDKTPRFSGCRTTSRSPCPTSHPLLSPTSSPSSSQAIPASYPTSSCCPMPTPTPPMLAASTRRWTGPRRPLCRGRGAPWRRQGDRPRPSAKFSRTLHSGIFTR